MLFGPIFAADVVTSARRTRYYWLRVMYAGLVLVIMALCYAPNWTGGEPTIQSTATLAAGFFSAFSILQITAVVLLGPAFTAGAIATERERRTIEYLFATDLSNVEIIYGKFAAALARMIVLLLVAIPILAIARLLGGIAYDRMLAVFVVTASTAVTVVALALTISVWCPRAREAVIRTYLALFGLLVLPLVVSTILQILFFAGARSYLGWLESVLWPLMVGTQIVTAANPYVLLTAILSQDLSGVMVAGRPWGAGSLWGSVGLLVGEQTALVLLCAILAPWAVRRVHLNAAGKGARSSDAPLPVDSSNSAVDARPASVRPRRWFRRRRRAVYENSPMLWKELVSERAQSRVGWIGRIVLALALLLILGTTLVSFGMFIWYDINGSRGGRPPEAFLSFAAAIATLVTCGGLLLVAARGATSITSERERDTWNALLATPLESSEIVWAKFWGSLYAGRWMIPLLGFFWLLCVLAYPAFVVGIPFIVGTIVILAFFFTALGVIFSLHCSNSLRSLGGTLGVCILLGGGYYLCCACVFAPLAAAGAGASGLEDLMALTMLSPWPPFLAFAPYFLGVVVSETNSGSELTELIVAYVFGNFGYCVAGGMLLASAISGFNRAVGRREVSQIPPAVAATVVPEIAEPRPVGETPDG